MALPTLKRVSRSAEVAFCPSAPFIATATVAGAVSEDFNSSSVLEVRELIAAVRWFRSLQLTLITHGDPQIFSIDFGSTDQELHLGGGAVPTPERFTSLCWSTPGADTKTYPVRSSNCSGGGRKHGVVEKHRVVRCTAQLLPTAAV